MFAEIEKTETFVVIPTRSIRLRMELEGITIIHCDTRFPTFSKEGLLIGFSDGCRPQLFYAALNQIPDQKLLQIRTAKVPAGLLRKRCSHSATKALLLSWVIDCSGRLRQNQAASFT